MAKTTLREGGDVPVSQQNSDERKQASGWGCLVRLTWTLLGLTGLIFSIYGVWISRHGGITWHDYLFWMVIVIMIGARYLDIALMGGQTVTGKPATRAHWRRFTLILLVGGLALWLGVHALTRLMH
jgi:hypothetical protein